MFCGGTPRLSKYAEKSGLAEYWLRTRGMPIRIVSRFLSSSLRFALAPVNAILAGGSATFGGLKLRQTAFAPSSTKFGLAPLTASSPFLITRISYAVFCLKKKKVYLLVVMC